MAHYQVDQSIPLNFGDELEVFFLTKVLDKLTWQRYTCKTDLRGKENPFFPGMIIHLLNMFLRNYVKI